MNCNISFCDSLIRTRKEVPHFNKHFYEAMPEAKECLQNCYNGRMKAHFGSTAEKEHLLMDFAEMKKEYERYEKWHPLNRIKKDYEQEYDAK